MPICQGKLPFASLDVFKPKPSDLWPVVGSKGRVSEILTGKRAISKEQAKKLAELCGDASRLFRMGSGMREIVSVRDQLEVCAAGKIAVPMTGETSVAANAHEQRGHSGGHNPRRRPSRARG